jgi:hypothetical protein
MALAAPLLSMSVEASKVYFHDPFMFLRHC